MDRKRNWILLESTIPTTKEIRKLVAFVRKTLTRFTTFLSNYIIIFQRSVQFFFGRKLRLFHFISQTHLIYQFELSPLVYSGRTNNKNMKKCRCEQSDPKACMIFSLSAGLYPLPSNNFSQEQGVIQQRFHKRATRLVGVPQKNNIRQGQVLCSLNSHFQTLFFFFSFCFLYFSVCIFPLLTLLPCLFSHSYLTLLTFSSFLISFSINFDHSLSNVIFSSFFRLPHATQKPGISSQLT